MILTHVPAFRSETTDGLMQTGGTNMRVKIKSFGCDLQDAKMIIYSELKINKYPPFGIHGK